MLIWLWLALTYVKIYHMAQFFLTLMLGHLTLNFLTIGINLILDKIQFHFNKLPHNFSPRFKGWTILVIM